MADAERNSTILFAHAKIFTRLILILTRSLTCTKILTNLKLVVKFAYFSIKSNIGREHQEKFLFFRATFEQLSLQKATFDYF